MSPPLLHWLPTHLDLDTGFAAIKATADPQARIDRIIALASHQLDFIEIGKLDRQLERTLTEIPEPKNLQPIRLGWLGSSTLEHLVPSARIACLRRGLLLQSYVAPYNQYRQELFDPASGLARFRPHVILLALDHEEVDLCLSLAASSEDVRVQIDRKVQDIKRLWATAAEQLGAVVIQQTIPNIVSPVFGSFDALLPSSPTSVVDRLNHDLVAAAAETRTPVLDLAKWSSRLGHEAWFDRVRWLQAKQLVSPLAAPFYGDLLARVIGAMRGRSSKCLVLDLDNTVWGGVVGDDGVERLVLGHGSAAGEAFDNFQRYAQRLKERGIVLAVCSKNTHAIAEAAFKQHPEMRLKLDDIAVFMANWDDKATNIKRIADALNLGLDAFVFFDDNPVERALVRSELPMVAVPEVPEDPAHFVRTLADAGYFESVSFTEDDLARAKQYQENGGRFREMETATDMPSFLKGLEMSLKVGLLDEHNLVRVTQLINKTNQFNVTTRRYSEPELRAFANQAGNLVLHFRLVDRFGDNGLIAVMLARAENSTLVVDTLLMSCRVLGRGVEQAICNVLVERASTANVQEILGEYIPTPRNGMVSDLFGRLGFSPVASDVRSGVTRWSLRVTAYSPHATFIQVEQ